MKYLYLFLTGLCWVLNAYAHKPSDSYLSLHVEGATIAGQWDIALRDLDYAIGLDADGDARITWGEVKTRHKDIAAYAMARLHLSEQGRPCPAQVTAHLIDDHTDGAYAVLRFHAQCSAVPQTLVARYALFFDLDPQHKGLLRLSYRDNTGGYTAAGIFSPETATQQFILRRPSLLGQFLDYGREGVWHIWIGFDHILFLLALLLPAVVYREHKTWQAVDTFRRAFWDVFKIVTSFTAAHSITLSLAALGILHLPSQWVESAIAASVVIAALNNIHPLFRESRWIMAFLFGLIHGFGFANVLADLGLPHDALVLALVGFNLGVETGQLAIVALFLPLAFALRQTQIYRRIVLLGGSVVIALLASVWLVERILDWKILPI